jgi:hypothetical protein
MISSWYFSVLSVLLVLTCSNARFINMPWNNPQADQVDPHSDPRLLEAIGDAYGSNTNPSRRQPENNHVRPGGNEKLLEAIGDAYGVDINPVGHDYRHVGPTHAHQQGQLDVRLLEAIGDAYGVNIAPVQNPTYIRPMSMSPHEQRILEAIADTYGSDISGARGQPQLHGEEAKLFDAIADTYGMDVGANIPQLGAPQNEWARRPGAIQPNPADIYQIPSENPMHPARGMPSREDLQGELGHTGNSVHDDHQMAHIPPPPGRTFQPPDSIMTYNSKDTHFVPSVEEIDQWQKDYNSKQRDFFNQYKSKGNKGVTGRFTSIDTDYYSEPSNANQKFSPNQEFFHVDRNVSKMDIGNLDYKLVKSQSDYLDYDILRLTPHGRHLLLITLLEDLFIPLWVPRFKGKLAYYLPISLRPPGQPLNPPKGAIFLRDIVSHGRIVKSDEMLTRFRKRMPSVFRLDEDISRFNLTHAEAVGSLLEIILGQETFDSTLSILVFIHNYVQPRIFSDTVLTVVDVREDVGFILPSMQTINPYDYFQISRFKELTKYDEKYGPEGEHRRTRRQAMNGNDPNFLTSFRGRGNQGGGNTLAEGNTLPGRGQVWRISWNEGQFRTIPTSDPESQLWYFREDPLVSAHHLHWHLKMSNRQVPVWHPSNGLNMDRRGEMFYFMHKQMLCRYNSDRLGLGLELTTAFLPNEWGQPVFPGYDPKLSESSGRIYPPRPAGARLPDISGMVMAYRMVRQGIREGTLRMVSGPQRLGYAQGVDYGISALGDALEAFVPSPVLGNLHNDGHQQVGMMHVEMMGNEGTTGLGVMGNPNGAVRDPLFFRWHKLIDDIHQEYKNTLPAYGDQELDFPGVEITAAHVQSERGQVANNLYTFMDTTSVRLQSVDLQATDGSSVNIAYDRLNHIPYTYHVNINSKVEAQGILRFFLIPSGIRLPAHTDVTQVAIEMDRFLIFLNPGDNYFTRHSTSSPFVSKSAMPLVELQERLLMGEISEEQFNWSGCGWPQSMVLPRGREGGMPFRLYIMVSQLLPGDSAMTANWERMQYTSWSWCGVRRNEGDVPDSRPMGFPLDRAPPNGNWQSLMFKDGEKRGNHFSVDLSIRHDPVGTTSRRNAQQG